MANLITLALLVVLLPFSVCAQDIGNVGLRTVNATVANGVTCTGAAQNFSTSQGITNFNNLGQTSHLATATSNASNFQMEIDGIDSLGNVFRLSDLQLGVPSSAKGGIVVTASGYMTNIRISVVCSAGATFSVSYSGSFSPQPPNFAGALLNAVDKLPFQTAAANANSSTTFQTPTGNSAGTIIFQYSGVGPVGSTINAQCLTNAGTNLTLFTFSPTTAATAQLFSVASGPCPFVTLSYTSGGASAVTYNLEYVFVSQGGAQATQSVSFPSAQPVTVTPATTAPTGIAGQSANGALGVALPGNWSISNAPAAGTQATSSRAAGAAGVRHVVNCITASFVNNTNAGAQSTTLVIRDGASGVGTIIWQTLLSTTGNGGSFDRVALCGLNITGSAATAMTVEFTAAPPATETEIVQLSGYDAGP